MDAEMPAVGRKQRARWSMMPTARWRVLLIFAGEIYSVSYGHTSNFLQQGWYLFCQQCAYHDQQMKTKSIIEKLAKLVKVD
jgi:hypothetical protein